jgi:NAD(P)-dependent dehydrogenase (short-subunit alcohol dehydrogenase family)
LLPPANFSSASADQYSRVAIVTGSARGIGKAIALQLANDGYDVAINDIPANKSGAEETAKEIQSLGRKSTVVIADVSKLKEVEEMIQKAVNDLGPLNVRLLGREPAAQLETVDCVLGCARDS